MPMGKDAYDRYSGNGGIISDVAARRLVEEQFIKHSLNGLIAPSHQDHLTDAIAYSGGIFKDTIKVNKKMDDPLQMIAMRMRWTSGMLFPLPHISAYVKGNVAIVFVVNKENKPVCLEDDAELFPSDSLITQLRLLVG